MERIRKTRKSFNVPGHAHELTFSCYKRSPLLDDDYARQVFLENLDRAREKREFDVWAYVLMPEHAHILIWPRNIDYSVPNILKAIKQPVSQRLIAEWRKTDLAKLEEIRSGTKNGKPLHTFWQAGGGYDQNIYKPDTTRKVIEYIHMNPVKRGLVESSTDWRWSSAAAYEGREEVEFKVDLYQE